MAAHPIVDDLYTRRLETGDVERISVASGTVRGQELAALVLATGSKRWRSPE